MPCKPACICKCNTGMCECWDGTRTNKLTLVASSLSANTINATKVMHGTIDIKKKEKP